MSVPPGETPPQNELEEARGNADETEDLRLPAHRRFWRYYNRPYVGCGFLWTALLLLLMWVLLILIFPQLSIRSVY